MIRWNQSLWIVINFPNDIVKHFHVNFSTWKIMLWVLVLDDKLDFGFREMELEIRIIKIGLLFGWKTDVEEFTWWHWRGVRNLRNFRKLWCAETFVGVSGNEKGVKLTFSIVCWGERLNVGVLGIISRLERCREIVLLDCCGCLGWSRLAQWNMNPTELSYNYTSKNEWTPFDVTEFISCGSSVKAFLLFLLSVYPIN